MNLGPKIAVSDTLGSQVGPAGGVNAKPMGPRKPVVGTLIQVNGASSQLL